MLIQRLSCPNGREIILVEGGSLLKAYSRYEEQQPWEPFDTAILDHVKIPADWQVEVKEV